MGGQEQWLVSAWPASTEPREWSEDIVWNRAGFEYSNTNGVCDKTPSMIGILTLQLVVLCGSK
jgi:hypothetical protein